VILLNARAAARPELGGRRTEDLDEAGFGCRIHRLAGLDRRSADGAEADDAAAPPLRHLLPEGTDQLERRTQVQRHHPVELLAAVVEDPLPHIGRRREHQHVDVPEIVRRLDDRFVVQHIELVRRKSAGPARVVGRVVA